MQHTTTPLEPRPIAGVAAVDLQPLTPRPVPGSEVAAPPAKDKKPAADQLPSPGKGAALALLFFMLHSLYFIPCAHAQWTTNLLTPTTNGGVAVAYGSNSLTPTTNGGVAAPYGTNTLGSSQTWTWSTYGNNPTNFPTPNAGVVLAATNGTAFYVYVPVNPANGIVGWYTNAPSGMVSTIGSYPVWYTNLFTGYYIYTNTSNHHLVTSDTYEGMTNGIYGPNTWDLGYDSGMVVSPNLPIQFYTIYRF